MSKKPILWITYAWLDNEDNDVDFIVSDISYEIGNNGVFLVVELEDSKTKKKHDI